MRRRTLNGWMAGSLSLALLSATGAGLLATSSAALTATPLEFDSPSGLAFGAGHLWVTNEAGNSVTEIDPANGSWITTLRSKNYRFNRPTAITDSGADLFVTNAGDTVTELRASNGALVRVISGRKFHFNDPVAITAVANRVLVLNAGRPGGSPYVPGSITEVNASTGAFVHLIAGAPFGFVDPAALTVAGANVLVADKGDNAVTEARVASGAFVRVVSQQGLSAPDGLAYADGEVWVSDSATNAATEIDAATGQVVVTETDANPNYGFGSPSAAIASGDNVYIASPFGTSPMVTKVAATTGVPSWYMCNTNGPYYFSLLSAFAVSGTDLWVASRSGANSQTPGAATGSLTELSTGDGSLLMTVPLPPASSTTTSTTTTAP